MRCGYLELRFYFAIIFAVYNLFSTNNHLKYFSNQNRAHLGLRTIFERERKLVCMANELDVRCFHQHQLHTLKRFLQSGRLDILACVQPENDQ